jgi:hypothetical protein
MPDLESLVRIAERRGGADLRPMKTGGGFRPPPEYIVLVAELDDHQCCES